MALGVVVCFRHLRMGYQHGLLVHRLWWRQRRRQRRRPRWQFPAAFAPSCRRERGTTDPSVTGRRQVDRATRWGGSARQRSLAREGPTPTIRGLLPHDNSLAMLATDAQTSGGDSGRGGREWKGQRRQWRWHPRRHRPPQGSHGGEQRRRGSGNGMEGGPAPSPAPSTAAVGSLMGMPPPPPTPPQPQRPQRPMRPLVATPTAPSGRACRVGRQQGRRYGEGLSPYRSPSRGRRGRAVADSHAAAATATAAVVAQHTSVGAADRGPARQARRAAVLPADGRRPPCWGGVAAASARWGMYPTWVGRSARGEDHKVLGGVAASGIASLGWRGQRRSAPEVTRAGGTVRGIDIRISI